jgi:hypothetical protein
VSSLTTTTHGNSETAVTRQNVAAFASGVRELGFPVIFLFRQHARHVRALYECVTMGGCAEKIGRRSRDRRRNSDRDGPGGH